MRSIRSDILTDTPQVQLEHMIGSLRDNIIFGEITPKVITGNSKATVCTADQAIRFILSHQDDWVLGSFDYPGVSNPYKFDGDSLYDALETVSNSLKDAWWSYNMSVYPFRLNITRKGNAVGSEMRAGRNLRTITRTIDKTAMYTRFYPIGNNDLHIDGDYLEENSEIYGVISKVETDASITTKAELERFAMERLRDHCEPTVTVDVEGLELADATGEPLDRLYADLTLACIHCGDYDSATIALRQAVRWNPMGCEHRLNLADLYRIAGDMREYLGLSFSVFERASQVAHLVRAYLNFAEYFQAIENPRAAAACLQVARRLDPQDPALAAMLKHASGTPADPGNMTDDEAAALLEAEGLPHGANAEIAVCLLMCAADAAELGQRDIATNLTVRARDLVGEKAAMALLKLIHADDEEADNAS